ncbi:MAG TPA: Gmad2 immunoglobulin-like domain-containing protein [Candidatus Pacearchaeota archaeon]|nr:Gmad2 immunoglobulin-like domain-containing protein [Candidatus Pacearchaeota archaeon]
MALAIISVIGVVLTGAVIVFVQYQSSKVPVMSGKTANRSSTATIEPVKTEENKNEENGIKNFQECVAGGNPVEEIYPARCSTPDGKIFTQNIGNEMELADLIMIYSPRPNAKIASPLIISGKARGNWFFEASFPVKLMDENGNELANGTAAAQSDWMTEDFVEFLATFEFTAPPTTAGTLILQKDNPSGLSEHNNQLIVPVEFE